LWKTQSKSTFTHNINTIAYLRISSHCSSSDDQRNDNNSNIYTKWWYSHSGKVLKFQTMGSISSRESVRYKFVRKLCKTLKTKPLKP